MRQSLTSLLLCITPLAISVLASPAQFSAAGGFGTYNDISKLTFETMKYIGPTTPGGPDVELYGTAEEVYHQILAINPDFRIEDFPPPEHRPLGKRYRLEPRCNIYSLANYGRIGDGIYYLKRLPGACSVGAGWGTCTRLSCSYSSGIYLCNDNTFPIAPTCSYMALYAEDILRGCPQDISTGTGRIRGQEFDTDNYNIIVSAPSYFGQSC
ncbi:hypothetical protein B0O99DRAFT_224553 [Bisporella sp. PMI_857]|nr:hypothetical protein B0O99DRAFT_224553 [Bisporella sp. PMI_857]